MAGSARISRRTVDLFDVRSPFPDGSLPIWSNSAGQWIANLPNVVLNAILPTQTGQSGKILSTNGTTTAWIVSSGGGGGSRAWSDLTGVASTIPFDGNIQFIDAGDGNSVAMQIVHGEVDFGNRGLFQCNWQGDPIPAAYLPSLNGFTAPTASVALNSQKIINLADGSSTTDAATWGQTQNLVSATANGLDWKNSARVASSTNINISSPGSTIDGVTLASGNRVLLSGQSTGSQNGVWIFNGSASAMTRAMDADANAEVTGGLTVQISEGTHSGALAVLTTADPIVIDTTALTFTFISGPGAYTAGTGISIIGSAVSINATYTGQTSITTLGTIGTGTWNAGSVSANGTLGATGLMNVGGISATGEHLITANLSGFNVLAVRHLANDGYSAYTGRDKDNHEIWAIGGPAGSGGTPQAIYLESSRAGIGSGTALPIVMVQTTDFGSPGTFTYSQTVRLLLDADGTLYLKDRVGADTILQVNPDRAETGLHNSAVAVNAKLVSIVENVAGDNVAFQVKNAKSDGSGYTAIFVDNDIGKRAILQQFGSTIGGTFAGLAAANLFRMTVDSANFLVGTTSSGPVVFAVNSAEVGRFDTSGNFNVKGLLKAGSGPTTLTDSAGKVIFSTINAPLADFSLNSHKITNLSDGTVATDAVTLGQMTALINGHDWKDSARVAVPSNVMISSPGASLDGVSLSSGDRVLLAGQTIGSQNGIYVFNGSASAMTRATDADASAEVTSGMSLPITEGTKAGDVAILTTPDPIVLGTTSLAFTYIAGPGAYVQGSNITITGNSIAVSTSPSFTTPTLGVATATTINKVTLTTPSTGSTLTVADGKTLTASNTLTFAGTDSSTLNVGAGGTLGAGAFQPQTVLTGTSNRLNASNGGVGATTVDISASYVGQSSITTLGTVATGVWNGTAVDVAHGGSGVAMLTAYAPLFGGTTTTGPVQSGTVGTTGQVMMSNGAGALPSMQTFKFKLGSLFDGGGVALSAANSIVYTIVPRACTILSYTILGDVSGSVTVTCKKCTYANFPTTADITGGANLVLSSAQKNRDTTLSGWTTALAEDDVLELAISGTPASVTRILVNFKVG